MFRKPHPRTLADHAHHTFMRICIGCLLVLVTFTVINADPVKRYHLAQASDYDMLYAQAYALSQSNHKHAHHKE